MILHFLHSLPRSKLIIFFFPIWPFGGVSFVLFSTRARGKKKYRNFVALRDGRTGRTGRTDVTDGTDRTDGRDGRNAMISIRDIYYTYSQATD